MHEEDDLSDRATKKARGVNIVLTVCCYVNEKCSVGDTEPFIIAF